jgi:hypothetical protein
LYSLPDYHSYKLVTKCAFLRENRGDNFVAKVQARHHEVVSIRYLLHHSSSFFFISPDPKGHNFFWHFSIRFYIMITFAVQYSLSIKIGGGERPRAHVGKNDARDI